MIPDIFWWAGARRLYLEKPAEVITKIGEAERLGKATDLPFVCPVYRPFKGFI